VERGARGEALLDAITAELEAARRSARPPEPARPVVEIPEAVTRRILDAVPGGIVVVDATGAILRANATACRLLGLSYDALVERYIADFEPETVHEDGSPCPVGDYPVARCLATGEAQPPMTIGVRRPDGERSWCVFTAVPLHAPEDGVSGAAVTFLDVTERKRIEEALRSSEERFRTLLQHSPDYILMVDRDARIVYINRIAPGYDPDDVIGRTCYEFVGEEMHRARLEEAHERAFATGEAVRLEFGATNGRWYATQFVPIGDAQGPAGRALLIASDVTDRVQAEEERRCLDRRIQETQKVEGLAVLAGGLAHDFNNLLVGILGNTELALLELGAEAAARPLLENTQRAALRAAELTRQLRAYSGRGELIVEQVDLNAIVAEMPQLLGSTLSRKAEVRLDLAAELPAIEADATQLRQVVMNLLTNASEALAEGAGHVRGRTGVVDREAAAAEATHGADELRADFYVYVEVEDDGVGMDEATQRRIFDPFFTTKFTGRGLGLAAVLGIVRAHRGAIRLRSAPGEGTSLRVMFPGLGRPAPRPPAPARRSASSSEGESAGRRGTVLVIDDEESVRQVARRGLEEAGYAVLTAADGRRGVEAFRSRADEVAVVLLDLLMPDKDGEEVFSALQAIRPDVRVVLSSGFGEDAASERFVARGLAGVLAKPYGLEELQGAIARAAGATTGE